MELEKNTVIILETLEVFKQLQICEVSNKQYNAAMINKITSWSKIKEN